MEFYIKKCKHYSFLLSSRQEILDIERHINFTEIRRDSVNIKSKFDVSVSEL